MLVRVLPLLGQHRDHKRETEVAVLITFEPVVERVRWLVAGSLTRAVALRVREPAAYVGLQGGVGETQVAQDVIESVQGAQVRAVPIGLPLNVGVAGIARVAYCPVPTVGSVGLSVASESSSVSVPTVGGC